MPEIELIGKIDRIWFKVQFWFQYGLDAEAFFDSWPSVAVAVAVAAAVAAAAAVGSSSSSSGRQ